MYYLSLQLLGTSDRFMAETCLPLCSAELTSTPCGDRRSNDIIPPQVERSMSLAVTAWAGSGSKEKNKCESGEEKGQRKPIRYSAAALCSPPREAAHRIPSLSFAPFPKKLPPFILSMRKTQVFQKSAGLEGRTPTHRRKPLGRWAAAVWVSASVFVFFLFVF